MASKAVPGPQPKEVKIDCLKEVDCKQGAVRAIRFNVDGSYCMTAGSDKSVKLWNPFRPLLLKTYSGHGQEVYDVSSSCDNSQLVTVGADRNVLLWDVSTGQCLRRWRVHAAAVTTVRFNENGSAAVSGGQDNLVLIWDVRARGLKPAQELKEATDTITSVRVYEYEIVAASVDNKVRRYDIRVGEMVSDFLGAAVTCASFTNDSQGMLVSTADDAVRLLDKDSGELLAEYTGHKSGDCVLESCIDATDSKVLSGSACGHVWVWDLVDADTSPIMKLPHSPGRAVCSIGAHPTRGGIYLSCGGRTFKLWGDTDLEAKSSQDL